MDTSRTFGVTGVPIYVYDNSKPAGKKVTPGAANDTLDYCYNGAPATLVAMDNYCSVKIILVIK